MRLPSDRHGMDEVTSGSASLPAWNANLNATDTISKKAILLVWKSDRFPLWLLMIQEG